ncbi:MAG: S8 family serine peptidase, partial [Sphingobacteriales bacterium]|nr:S8 family serine peptidase [Sphingobacteriales bacterium]
MKLKGRNSSFRSMCAAMMLAIATAFVPFNIKAQSLVLDFENQPYLSTSWSENGYNWSAAASPGGITFGDAALGGFKLETGAGTSSLSACEVFNVTGFQARTSNTFNGVLLLKFSAFDSSNQLIGNIELQQAVNTAPNTYIPVTVNWPGTKSIQIQLVENSGSNGFGRVFIDAVSYNLTGIPCTPPAASIGLPAVIGSLFQTTSIPLANYSGTCLNLQWQVNEGDGQGFVDINPGDNAYFGAQGSELVIIPQDASISGNQYRCVLVGACGTVITDTTTFLFNTCNFNPTITSNKPSNSWCQDEVITLTASAGDAYSWFNEATSQSVTMLAGGTGQATYSVVVDSAGCQGVASIVVNTYAPPQPIIYGDTIVCFGSPASLYIYSNGPESEYEGAGSFTIPITQDTVFSYTVTSPSGCSASGSQNLYVNPEITVGQVQVTPPSCPSIYDGVVIVNGIDGGIATGQSYTVLLYNNYNSFSTTNDTIWGVQEGDYTLAVYDETYCSLTQPLSIESVNNLEAILSPASQVTCSNSAELTLQASGGSGPYTLTITDPGLDGYLFSVLLTGTDTTFTVGPGTYFATVSDTTGCDFYTAYVSVLAVDLPPPVIQAEGGSTLCSGSSKVLSVLGNGGSALHFDGDDDVVYGTVDDLPTGYSERTVEAWIRPTDSLQTNSTLVTYGATVGDNISYVRLLYLNGYVAMTTGYDTLFSQQAIPTNAWSHVAFTLEGTSNAYFLVNGIVQDGMELGFNTPFTQVHIGNDADGNSGFEGDIDEVRMWDIYRTAGQVQIGSQYSVDTSMTGIVLNLRMDEASGSTTANAQAPFTTPFSINGASWIPSGAPLNSGYTNYAWSNGASSSAITVNAAGTYTVLASNTAGCSATATGVSLTSIVCIQPYYPPPGGGKVINLIGPELTSLFINQDSLNADSVEFIYNIQQDSVYIEVIVNAGQFDSTLTLLQTSAYGLTDTISNGDNEFIITGKFPIENLTKLDSLPLLINYVRPYYPPVSAVGVALTEGDKSMIADSARSAFGLTGSGVKVGVISNSYNTILGNPAQIDVLNGDLPGAGNPFGRTTPVHVLKDFPYGSASDEGRAMLQLIHDVAPDAELAFRSGFISAGDFAEAIRELRDADCDIIVDDVTYITEPFFQDGLVARAVDEVKADSVSYFSSAGNYGARSYSAVFNPAPVPSGFTGTAHNFGGGDIFQSLTLAPGNYTIALQWNDSIYSLGQLPGATHDLDIYLVDDAGAPLFGFNRKNNWGDPIEVLPFTVYGTSAINLMVTKTWGATNVEFKYIIFRGEAVINEYNSGTATCVGQANATGAMAVGAVLYSNTPAFGVSPPTPAGFSSTGGAAVRGVVRSKPDFMAPNGGNTTVQLGAPNIDGDAFPNFFGTSAAAPHAAGVAALLMEGRQKFFSQYLRPDSVRALLKSTAIDMGDPGFDFKNGSGLIQTDAALETFAQPRPVITHLVPPSPMDTPGTAAMTIEILGNYLRPTSYIKLREDTIYPVYVSDSKLTATIPAFSGNPPLTVYTPPITPSVLDGGTSDTLYFFPEVRKKVLVIADNKTKRYGEQLPAFTATVLVDSVPYQNLGLTLADLGLESLSFNTPCTPFSNVGIYFIQPVIPTPVADDSGSIVRAELYTFQTVNGLLFNNKMPLTI